MKFKNFLMSGMIAALAAFFVVGCNENVGDPDDNNDDVAAATSLKAVSLSATSVGLSWAASTTTGATYKVSWANGSTSVGSADVSTTTHTVSGLTEGTAYVFTVVAVDADDNESDPVTVTWAPAARYTNDQDAGGVIRIYERSAPTGKGTGLVLTPDLDGPRNVSVAGTIGTNPDLANVHLIADVNAGTGTFTIGPSKASAFDDFTNYSLFPNNVQVSDNYVVTSGLDNWYESASLANMFTTNNKEAFVIQNQQTGNQGVGFAVRMGTGVSGQFRYARIFVVPGASGQLIQNDGNNYVVLHVSFQNVAGVPYAKGN